MANADLKCWNCGAGLPGVPLPVGRGEECPKCYASIRACRGCNFYDPDAANSCREPVAEPVGDKEAANTCDYYRPALPGAASEDGEAAAARAKLENVFGDAGQRPPDRSLADEAADFADRAESEAEAARRRLEEVFGKKE